MSRYIDIVFDGPPDHEAGRFIEVEDDSGKSLSVGEWVRRPDGFYALRITKLPVDPHCATCQCNKLHDTAKRAPDNPQSKTWHW